MRKQPRMLAARELLVMLALAAISRQAAAQYTYSQVKAMDCRTARTLGCEKVSNQCVMCVSWRGRGR